MSMKYTGCW